MAYKIYRIRSKDNPQNILTIVADDVGSGWFVASEYYTKNTWEEVNNEPIKEDV